MTSAFEEKVGDLPSRRWWALAVIALAQLMVVLELVFAIVVGLGVLVSGWALLGRHTDSAAIGPEGARVHG